jgi:hypothetical protein
MGLVIDGEYYSKSRDAGPYVPPSVPSEKYKQNFDLIRWDKPQDEEREND